MSVSPTSSTRVDNVAELLRELGRLQAENRKLRRRIRDLEQSRDEWRYRFQRVERRLPRNDPRHGTVNGYSNLKCRCAKCRAAWRDYCRERDHRLGRHRPREVVNAERREEALARDSHGTEGRYVRWGCRCERCKSAMAAERRRRRHTPGSVKTHNANGYRNGCRCDKCKVAMTLAR